MTTGNLQPFKHVFKNGLQRQGTVRLRSCLWFRKQDKWTQLSLQQDAACLHTANVISDILHDMVCSRVQSNRFPERFGCGWYWPPCLPDMNPCVCLNWGYTKDRV